MSQITDEQIYQEYFRRLSLEVVDERLKLQEAYELYKDKDGNILLNIRENLVDSFVHKYTWTGCQQLFHNKPLFIKSAIETSKLCDEITSYLTELITV